MKYRAVKEYDDIPDKPIQIQKGESLHFVEESDPKSDWPNWVLCKGKNKKGWIPKQILEIKSDEATCLQDYSNKEHHLTINEVLIADYELNGWIWCCKEHSPEYFAWAPLNHLIKE